MSYSLHNSKQIEYYGMLTHRRLPNFVDQIFLAPQPAADFLQALTKRAVEDLDSWVMEKVLDPMRGQITRTTPKILARFLDALNDAYGGDAEKGIPPRLDGTAFMGLFTVPAERKAKPSEVNRSLVIINRLADILVPERIFCEPENIGTHLMLMMLITTQKSTNTWPIYLSALRNGDRQADHSMRLLLDFWGVGRVNPRFVSDGNLKTGYTTRELRELFTQLKPTKTASLPQEQSTTSTLQVEEIPDALIPVPQELVGFCNHNARHLTASFERSMEPWFKLVLKFNKNAEEHQLRAREMWNQTSWSNLCLRPNGHDYAAIKIPEMRDHGYRHVQLFPEGVFPEVRARIWFQLPLSGRMAYQDCELKDPSLGVQPARNVYEATSSLLRYLSIHTQWTIVTNRWPKGVPNESHTTSHTNGHRTQKPVRPRWMKLGHENWKPTQYALDRAWRARNQLPPAGKTFYMYRDDATHLERLNTVAADFAQPLFSLTHQDLDDIRASAS